MEIKEKKIYVRPESQLFEVGLSGWILATSVQSGVETEGQDYDEKDYSGNGWD